MQKIHEKLADLNALVLAGRALEAFDKYYHPEVVMQENHLEPTVGKEANRQREIAFFDAVTEFRSARVMGMAVGENISYVTWKYDYSHKDWGVRDYTQVSVQTWKDGLIVREQFFYGN